MSGQYEPDPGPRLPSPDLFRQSDPVTDEIAAREAYLRRQDNVGRGWHPNRWQGARSDPGTLLDQLGDQAIDGGQRAAEARRIGAVRAARADRPNMTAPELRLALMEMDELGIRGVGHEPDGEL